MMPFPGGLDSTTNGALIFSFGFALFYLSLTGRPASLRGSAARGLAIAMLALMVLLEDGARLLIAALALSAAGEAILAQNDDRAAPIGIVILSAAYLTFAALFATASIGVGFVVEDPLRILAAFAIAGVGVLVARRSRDGMPTIFRLTTALHALALGVMAFTALSVPGYWIAGAAFVLLLAYAFLERGRFCGDASAPNGWLHAAWASRYAAQLVIVLAGLLPSAG